MSYEGRTSSAAGTGDPSAIPSENRRGKPPRRRRSPSASSFSWSMAHHVKVARARADRERIGHTQCNLTSARKFLTSSAPQKAFPQPMFEVIDVRRSSSRSRRSREPFSLSLSLSILAQRSLDLPRVLRVAITRTSRGKCITQAHVNAHACLIRKMPRKTLSPGPRGCLRAYFPLFGAN